MPDATDAAARSAPLRRRPRRSCRSKPRGLVFAGSRSYAGGRRLAAPRAGAAHGRDGTEWGRQKPPAEDAAWDRATVERRRDLGGRRGERGRAGEAGDGVSTADTAEALRRSQYPFRAQRLRRLRSARADGTNSVPIAPSASRSGARAALVRWRAATAGLGSRFGARSRDPVPGRACASLDPASTQAVEELIETAHAEGTKIVLVTHDIGQARRLADEVIFLHHGRIIEQAPAAGFFAAPSTTAARAYLGGLIPL